MRTVYLVRHGKPEFPGGKRMCLGRTDLPLSREGYAQAERAAKALPPVTAVFSSTLTRALETAQAIGAPVALPEFRELSCGIWDGLPFDEIRLRWPGLYEARGTDPDLLPPEAEPPAEGALRFRRGLEAALSQTRGDIALVAHSGILRAFLRSLGYPDRAIAYCQIIPLQYQNGIFTLQEE